PPRRHCGGSNPAWRRAKEVTRLQPIDRPTVPENGRAAPVDDKEAVAGRPLDDQPLTRDQRIEIEPLDSRSSSASRSDSKRGTLRGSDEAGFTKAPVSCPQTIASGRLSEECGRSGHNCHGSSSNV